MIKKIFSMVMLLMATLCSQAQTPMPLNPQVRHGKLDNGLNYYILHNEEPKQRANFYIAQKVGSTLETPEQLGLAHFLEHMAFNGTKNYPGKNMLNYLQSKGLRFGADINAYTSFDETVYNIDNVPTTNKALMDSVLLAIYDWSCNILLEEAEINAERGVIEEEWRSRNDANSRMLESILPVIYDEYQYEQTPIGKMEVVRNFKPEVLREYYKKWYRPDQQGIVIVGDFDVDEMEAKVKKLFGTVVMPANAAERTYPKVSDNEKPIYAYFTDKELQYPMAMVMFKMEKIPFEMRNTMEGYMQTSIVENLVSTMINNRLNDFSKKAECNYVYAGVSFGDFLVSKTKAALDITIIAKDNVQKAYTDALKIVAQACKTGFMESELVRARDEMLANYEKAYNERNNTKTENLAREIIRHFVDNEPSPGIEKEYEIVKQILPAIPVQALNQMLPQLITKENQVIIVTEPTKEGMVKMEEAQVVGDIQNIWNAEYEAYVDEVITDPLIAKLPAPGKIKATKEGQFGTTEFTLSNGARVIVKPTDFKQDEIVMTAYRDGGKRSYPGSQAANIALIEDVYNLAKMGPFDHNRLGKYLAGKKVGLTYKVGNTADILEGSTTVKDLPTFMELVYSSFTQLGADAEAYNTEINKIRSLMANQEKDANYVFSKHLKSATYGNNPMFEAVGVSTLDAANYDQMIDMLHKSLSNAADYTFIFTGNVDLNTFKTLMEQYIATLPSTGKKSAAPKQVTSITQVAGQIEDKFSYPMQTPYVMVYNTYSDTNIPYNPKNSVMVDLLGDALTNVFTETLREEEGGTYSPYSYAGLNAYTGQWSLVYVFQTNKDMQAKLEKRANDEFMKLLKEGMNEENFQKVKGAALSQYDINVRTNSYWDNKLMMLDRGIDDITGSREAIADLTLAEMNAFLKNLYNGKNRVQVVLEGVEEK